MWNAIIVPSPSIFFTIFSLLFLRKCSTFSVFFMCFFFIFVCGKSTYLPGSFHFLLLLFPNWSHSRIILAVVYEWVYVTHTYQSQFSLINLIILRAHFFRFIFRVVFYMACICYGLFSVYLYVSNIVCVCIEGIRICDLKTHSNQNIIEFHLNRSLYHLSTRCFSFLSRVIASHHVDPFLCWYRRLQYNLSLNDNHTDILIPYLTKTSNDI